MERNIFIKKIFITDTIINKQLGNNSIKTTLNQYLYNHYKYGNISNKIEEITNKIDDLYKEDSDKSQVFNLAYQPFNKNKLKFNYDNKLDKKWIVPVVNLKKDIYISTLIIDKSGKPLKTQNKHEKEDNNNINFLYDSDIKYSTVVFKNEHGLEEKALEELNNDIYSKMNITDYTVKNDHIVKVIRINDNNRYVSSSNIPTNTKTDTEKTQIKEIAISIINHKMETVNILENSDINIKGYLLLNPQYMINTDYNIYLGNQISFLDEIVNNKNKFKMNDKINNVFTNNTIEDFVNECNIDTSEENMCKYVSVDDFTNENDVLLNYLNIVKNIEKFDNIINIRQLQHIYNIYSYDLHKIPYCYIEYLNDILDKNIRDYLVNKYTDRKLIINKYKFYNERNITSNEESVYISNIYNINSDLFNDENITNLLKINTFDQGSLYDLYKYQNYLQNELSDIELNNDKTEIDLDESETKDLRVVKQYDTFNEYDIDADIFNDLLFTDVEYSNKVYLVEYNDLINLLDNNKYINKHDIYIAKVIFDEKKGIYKAKKNDKDAEENQKVIDLDYVPDGENEVSIRIMIDEHKLYIYNLLLNKSTDVVFHTYNNVLHDYYNYIPISFTKVKDNNFIKISNNIYTYSDYKKDNSNATTIFKKYNSSEYEFDHEKNTLINKKQQSIKYKIDSLKEFNKFVLTNNKTSKDKLKKTVSAKINNSIIKRNIYNESLIREEKKLNTEIAYKTDFYKMSYNLSTIDKNTMINYLKSINVQSINTTLKDKTQILNELKISKYHSEYTRNINNKANNIYELDKKTKLFSPICKYLNDYEFIEHIHIDSDKYNRAYYKLWEMLKTKEFIFKSDLKVLGIAESPGNFMKCIKTMMPDTWSWDNITILTLLTDEELTSQSNFINEFEKNLFRGEEDIGDFDGDLLKLENVKTFINYIKNNPEKKADLITADGGMEKTSSEYDIEEFIHIKLFWSEVITALFSQKEGGTFILKMYDLIHENTINILYILCAFYENVSIEKPYTSRPSNSEKYIYCHKFKGLGKDYETLLKKMLSILKKLTQKDKVTKKNTAYNSLSNIFDNIKNTNNIESEIIDFNNSIVIKTRYYYLEEVYNIIKNNDKDFKSLINNYFKQKFQLNKLVKDAEERSYFIKKIEKSIQLSVNLDLEVEPGIFDDFIQIKKNRSTYDNIMYPPHFKEREEINKELNETVRTENIKKYVKKYCISFNIEDLDTNNIITNIIFRHTEQFINNKNIYNLKDSFINNIKLNSKNINLLIIDLMSLCKIMDLNKIFSVYKLNVISTIRHFQNNIRETLGYYLCKYTYIPLYPKYIIYEDRIYRKNVFGVLRNSKYICYYSGDDLDIEEYDDFMSSSIHRSIIDDSKKDIELTANITGENLLNNLDSEWVEDLSVEHNISINIMNYFENYFNTTILPKDKVNLLQKIHLYTIQHNDSVISSDKIDLLGSGIYDIAHLLLKTREKDPTPKNTYLHAKYGQIINGLKLKDDIINRLYIRYIENKKIKKTSFIKDLQNIFINLYLSVELRTYIQGLYSSAIYYTIGFLTLIYNDYDTDKTNDTIENIYKFFISIENKILLLIYKNLPLHFETCIQSIIKDYEEIIKFPDFDKFKSTIDNEILVLNFKFEEHLYKRGLGEFKDKEVYHDYDGNLQTVITFLNDDNLLVEKKVAYIDMVNEIRTYRNISQHDQYRKIKLKLIKTEEELYKKDYILDSLNNCINYINSSSMFKILVTIQNNIEYDKNEMTNDKFELPKKITLYPNYESLVDEEKDIEINESLNMKAIIYLKLYIYEEAFEENIGLKREFIKRTYKDFTYKVNFDKEVVEGFEEEEGLKTENILVCNITKFTQEEILNNILSLSIEERIKKYMNSVNSNKHILNNKNFIQKNNINFYDEFKLGLTSTFNNIIYSVKNKYVELLHRIINMYIAYNELNDKSNDKFKNVVMRFSSNPKDFIIYMILNHKDDMIEYIKTNDNLNAYDINQIFEEIINTEDDFLNTVKTKYLTNTLVNRDILSGISSEKLKLKEFIKKFELSELKSSNIILFVNNIKKNLSFIINLPLEKDGMNLKQKYNIFQKYYESVDFNNILDVVKENNFNILNNVMLVDNLIDLQIIFSNILDTYFNYDFNNIYSQDDNIFKLIVVYRIIKSITNTIERLKDNVYNYNQDVNIENKYYWANKKLVKIDTYEVFNTYYDTDRIITSNTSYVNLFMKIIKNCYTDVINYDKIINDTDVNIEFTENNDNEYDDFGQFEEDLLGGEEEE